MWQSPSSGDPIRTYRIFWSSDGGNTWTKVIRPASTALTATVTGLEIGKTYAFRIQAMNGYAGLFSTPINVTLRESRVVHVAPHDVTVRAGDRVATLSWFPPNAGSGEVLGYVIRYTTDGQAWTKIARSGPMDLTTTVSGLTNGVGYAFRVRALTTRGPTFPSVPSVYSYPAAVPSAPKNVIASRVSEGLVTLTWDASDEGGRQITEYGISWDSSWIIRRSTTTGGYVFAEMGGESAYRWNYEIDVRETVRVEPGAQALVTLRNLRPDATYVFYVFAKNAVGSGGVARSDAVATQEALDLGM
jgi:titin